MKQKKLIGIALASYRPRADFLFEQLQSIQQQSWTNFRCVVTFDSPIAEVESAVAPFRADSRFSFIENPACLGLVGNFQKGLNAVMKMGADAIAFSDQDDVWYRNKLERMKSALEQLPERSLVHCDMHVIEKVGTKFKDSRTAWQRERRGVHNVSQTDLLIRNVVAGTGLLMDRSLVEDFPSIPEGFGSHDWFYAVAAASRGGVTAISEALYGYRLHDNNVAGIQNYQGLFHITSAIEKVGIAAKVKATFRQTRERAMGLQSVGGNLPWWSRIMIVSRWDLGIGYMVYGLLKGKGDPAIRRACWARAIGKVMETFAPTRASRPLISVQAVPHEIPPHYMSVSGK